MFLVTFVAMLVGRFAGERRRAERAWKGTPFAYRSGGPTLADPPLVVEDPGIEPGEAPQVRIPLDNEVNVNAPAADEQNEPRTD